MHWGLQFYPKDVYNLINKKTNNYLEYSIGIYHRYSF